MFGCTTNADSLAGMVSGTDGSNGRSGKENKGRRRVRGYRRKTHAAAVANMAKTKESPYTPINGAKRSGVDMLIPALPKSSQANPNVACVRSSPVQSAATAATA